jgi:tRNA A-37 threonylcarbamoyl transferase component Bud32
MFTPDQVHTIEAQLARKPGRTRVMQLEGTKIVIKEPEPPTRHWGYPILNLLAAILRQPLLRAVPAPGGSKAQTIEIMRLRALDAAGVSVPKVLHLTRGWFALSYLGHRSLDQLLRHDAGNGQNYWENGLAAILDLHRLGQTASQCFARNMIWHEGVVSFIDFEDDPVSAMPLASAQARDWLLYLHSTAFTLKFGPSEALAARFLHFLEQDNYQVQLEVLRAARTFGWLRFLPGKRKPWGRDVVATQSAAAILHHLQRQMRAAGIK